MVVVILVRWRVTWRADGAALGIGIDRLALSTGVTEIVVTNTTSADLFVLPHHLALAVDGVMIAGRQAAERPARLVSYPPSQPIRFASGGVLRLRVLVEDRPWLRGRLGEKSRIEVPYRLRAKLPVSGAETSTPWLANVGGEGTMEVVP